MVIIVFLIGFLLGLAAHAQSAGRECTDQGKVGFVHLNGVKPNMRYVIDGSRGSYVVTNPATELKTLLDHSIVRNKMVYFENAICSTHAANGAVELTSQSQTEWELILRDQ